MRNNNVLTQNRFMPLSVPSMDVNYYDNDVCVHEDDIFHDNINTISQMPINPSDRQTSYVNSHPERDVMDYRNTITVLGNSDYPRHKQRRKERPYFVGQHLQSYTIHEFNKHLKNKKAYYASLEVIQRVYIITHYIH